MSRPDAAPANPAPPGRSRRRQIVGLIFLLVAALTIGLPYALCHSDWGTRVVWQTITRLIPGTLHADRVSGTLAHGIRLQQVQYQDAKQQLRIDHLTLRWDWSWSPLRLTVQQLEIGEIDWSARPHHPTPLTLPTALTLPLGLVLEQVQIDKVVINPSSLPLSFTHLLLHGHSDGRVHTLILEHATTPAGQAHLQLQLHGTWPFALQGNARLTDPFGHQDFQLNLHATGSLTALNVDATLTGKSMSGQARLDVHPFSALPVQQIALDVRHLDPALFNAAAPHALLSAHALLKPQPLAKGADLAALVVSGPFTLSNQTPGALDQHRIPIRELSGMARLDAHTEHLTGLSIALTRGRLTGSADLDSQGTGQLHLQAAGLDLSTLTGRLQPSHLNGPLDLHFTPQQQQIQLHLQDARMRLAGTASIDAQTIRLDDFRVAADSGQMNVNGQIGRSAPQTFALKAALQNFNPAALLTTFVQAPDATRPAATVKRLTARINGNLAANGQITPAPEARVQFDFHDSIYAGLPMTGQGHLTLSSQQLTNSDAQLSIAGNTFSVKGGFGAAGDRLEVHVHAPALNRLGFGLAGGLQIDGVLAGTLQQPLLDARYQAGQLTFGTYHLATLTGQAHVDGIPSPGAASSLRLDADATDYQGGGMQLRQLHAHLAGSYQHHTLALAAAGQLDDRPIDLNVAATGQLQQAASGWQWAGTLNQLRNQGLPRVQLQQPVHLSIARNHVQVGTTEIQVDGIPIHLTDLSYAPGQLDSAGAIPALAVSRLLQLHKELTGQALPLATDLVVDVNWQIHLADQAQGFITLTQRSGDIQIPDVSLHRSFGLHQLAFRADLKGQRADWHVQAQADRIGTLQGDGSVQLQAKDGRLALTADAPLQAHLVASIPSLDNIASLAGPRVVLKGRAGIDLTATGTLAAPVFSGNINGDQLAVTLFDQGINLSEGIARLHVHDNIIDIQQLLLHGGTGTLRVIGQIPLQTENPDLNARVVADHLQLLADPAAKLTLSGQAAVVNNGEHLIVTGKFTVDHGQFSLPESSAPTLGDDVVIVEGNVKQLAAAGSRIKRVSDKKAGRFTPQANIDIDLGQDFHFKGDGADLQLAGLLNLTSAPGVPPQAHGSLHVVDGVVEAFGAKLQIERGIINFVGPINNPSLQILAMRRNQEVAAGVELTGTAEKPHLTLVSEPNVPDDQKLSWLLFGHGSDSGTAQQQGQTAAQTAALGLLNKYAGAGIAKHIGLDDLSIKSNTTGQQLLSIGKGLSDRLSLGYRQSITGMESVLELTYKLTQNWSVVAQGGTINGVKMLYSRRFDHWGEASGQSSPTPARQ